MQYRRFLANELLNVTPEGCNVRLQRMRGVHWMRPLMIARFPRPHQPIIMSASCAFGCIQLLQSAHASAVLVAALEGVVPAGLHEATAHST